MRMSALYLRVCLRDKRGHQDGCEPPRGCWELSSELLEEQLLLLAAKPSLQPLELLFKQTKNLSDSGNWSFGCL